MRVTGTGEIGQMDPAVDAEATVIATDEGAAEGPVAVTGGTRLVVYVPPLGGGTTSWDALVTLLSERRDADGVVFRTWPADRGDRILQHSRQPLTRYAQRLTVQINEWVESAALRGEPYRSIILVGQSIGGLVVRAAWLLAVERGHAWAGQVERVVLVAGLSRGFVTRFEPGRRNARTLGMKVAISTAKVVPGRFTWEDALAGSPFVTNLRLLWMRHAVSGNAPAVVQLLGDSDSIVMPGDSADTDGFPNGDLVEIAGADHGSILDVDGPTGDDRYLILRRWILGAAPPPPRDPPGDAATDDVNVVMIVHGIRAGDHGWVRKLGTVLRDDADQWVVVTPTYRFFSALQFAVPVTRRRKVRWFADHYSRLRAEMPTATFHFAGHSNGTYLLGRCLAEIPAMRFDRVYLAGSVLPSDYGWHRRISDGQVTLIRNDRGQRDIVVAVLAKGLRALGIRDIGGGGYDGFDALSASPRGATEWPYYPGGHGAPFDDSNGREGVRNVARFITQGTSVRPPYVNLEPATWLSRGSRVAGVALLVGIAVVGGLLLAPVWAAPSAITISASVVALLFVAALAVV